MSPSPQLFIIFNFPVTLLPAGGVCDQKTSKFFVSQGEESMAGYEGVKRVY
jgi:hypothetical protein